MTQGGEPHRAADQSTTSVEPAENSNGGEGRFGARIFRFGAVGVACAVTDFVIFALFLTIGVNPLAANAVAFLLANVQGYVLNATITFRDTDGRQPLSFAGYGRFLGAYLFGLVVSSAVIAALIGVLGPWPAKIAATVAAGFWNYLLTAIFVFARKTTP